MSDPAPNGWEMGAIFAGTVTVLGVIGQGIAFLLRWGDRRAVARLDRLAREEDELAEGWSAYRKRNEIRMAELEASNARLKASDDMRAREAAALRVAFDLVAGAMRMLDPGNNALALAEQVLASAFPLNPQVPPDMSAQLAAVEAADEALRSI